MKSCATCQSYAALQHQCRAKPPTAFIVPGPQGQPIAAGVFPAVQATDWCGAWTPDLTGANNGAPQPQPFIRS